MKLDHAMLSYGKENIEQWCKSLQHFRLCMSLPYPNDANPDRFLVVLEFSDRNNLEEILKMLEITIDESKEENSKFHAYSKDILAGWALIKNTSCYLRVNKLLLTIEIESSGTEIDPFDLDETTFNRAFSIEQFLLQLNPSFREPPFDDVYCISPKYYSNLFQK
ncbi:MAG: hypothetical protein ACFFDW_05630 [Candidatus Thorarchaeota archaeon]